MVLVQRGKEARVDIPGVSTHQRHSFGQKLRTKLMDKKKEPGAIAGLPNQKEETMSEDVSQLVGPVAT